MRSIATAGILIGFTVFTALCNDENNFGKQIVGASNRFAFELYDVIKEEKGKENVLISPLSISSCLGMLYMMANGSTAEEISEKMHFPSDHESAAVGFQQCLKGLDGEAISWANGIFLSKNFDVKDSYTDVLNKYWEASAEKLDFSGEPKKCREHINTWVANNTNQMIKDLLPDSFPSENTVMVLVSALHFKRPWLAKFVNTQQKGVFHLADGKTVDVDKIIAVASSFSHKRMEDIKADVLKIPYKGEKQSMIIFQPFESDGLPALEKHLLKLDLEDDVLKGMYSGMRLMVKLPKFKFEDSRTLQAPFQKLGMTRIFSSSDADFTKASESRNLVVSQIYHKTMIVVDEKGTEASAATGTEGVLASLPLSISVERPFLFAIREEASGLITFLGRVTRPDLAP